MLVRIIAVAMLLVIIGSLGSALVFLVRDQGRSTRTLKALTVRIALSIALFLLLIIGYLTGVIHPHGLVPGR